MVAKNHKVVYQNQVGYANFRKKTLLKKESVFQLASVSKQFTAAAIMLLKERKKNDDDDDKFVAVTNIRSTGGYYTQVYGGLLSTITFVWTLIAPALFPDRQFN